MNKPILITLKVATWLACLLPQGLLIYRTLTNSLGPDPSAALAFATGSTTLNLLTISLAITPLRKLSSRLNWLIKFRRLLGLFAFYYATLHLLVYVGAYAGFDWSTIVTDVSRRRFIMAGVAAWLLLLPLAATSTNWAIRKLGGKRWSRLHKLVYLAAVCGVVHFWWQVKPGVLKPIYITLILALLLLARPVQSWLESRKKSRRMAQATLSTSAQ
jgi:sulfoxide reductase heme-binding subunit YedZ